MGQCVFVLFVVLVSKSRASAAQTILACGSYFGASLRMRPLVLSVST
jgi:hypothetical protein